MGHAHLGIIPLPTTEDSYEQPQINFYPSFKRQGRDDPNAEHSQIDMLVFGGSKFKDREPNEDEFSDMTLMLTIPPKSSTYTLKCLPGAKMRCPDKFFSNMHVKCDLNKNTVTVIGNKAAHRINTGRRDPTHLRWKKVKQELGYGKAMD